MPRQAAMDAKTKEGLRKLAELDVRDVAALKAAAIPELCAGILASVKQVGELAKREGATGYEVLNAGAFQLNVLKALGGLEEQRQQRVIVSAEMADVGVSASTEEGAEGAEE